MSMATAMDVSLEICRIWDNDAATYDSSPGHCPQRPHELAAWRATLRGLLPDPPARVLDAGAGTGFVSLLLAEQGYQVTAVDLSAQMLSVLRSKADHVGLDVRTVQADAAYVESGHPFDVVVERHLIWTLPDPPAVLAAWRRAAPTGRLVLIEGTWDRRSGIAAVQARARRMAQWARRPERHSHDSYPGHIVRALPYAKGLLPAEAVSLVENSSWGAARFERLTDVERADVSDRSLVAELLGTTHRWVVSAGS